MMCHNSLVKCLMASFFPLVHQLCSLCQHRVRVQITHSQHLIISGLTIMCVCGGNKNKESRESSLLSLMATRIFLLVQWGGGCRRGVGEVPSPR